MFKGKIALVTGGTSGIGLYITEEYALEGAKVVFCGRREEKGKKEEERMNKVIKESNSDGSVDFVQCDISNQDQVDALFEHIENKYKRLDIAFNNAGRFIPPASNVEDLDLDATLIPSLMLNVVGTVRCCQHEVRLMKKQYEEDNKCVSFIINNASVAATKPAPRFAQYAIAKAGVAGITNAIAQETYGCGIRINDIQLGWTVPSEIVSNLLGLDEETAKEKLSINHPVGLITDRGDIKSSLFFLSTCRTYQGQHLHVDGGVMAHYGDYVVPQPKQESNDELIKVLKEDEK